MKSVLITGGAGFIGSHLVRYFLKNFDYQIINLDALTYAGNLENLRDIEQHKNYRFVKANINDYETLLKVFEEHQITDVIHLAAESHVDRSIEDPNAFIRTNVLGTANLLNAARSFWNGGHHRFHHISTDEVYGSLGAEGLFSENTAYDPRSPYSASKASSDHFVKAFHHTYGLPVVITNCSNNYGPFQFPEKLIPLMIHNIKNQVELPVYGKGENIRDWLWVEDHCSAIDVVFHKGKIGETYNVGGLNEWRNIDLVHALCDIVDSKLGREIGSARELIRFVKDRAGHDMRYAIDASKIEDELGWTPSIDFEQGLEKTVDWYLNNEEWLQSVTSGAYRQYYEKQYHER